MNKEVVKDVRTAVQLEQELQISYAQRGVAVLDIYSAEWGPCKAITESFRRLATDQGDGVHLRFLSVECHSILASLKHPEEQRNNQRPKNVDAIRDTLPEGWQGILEERAGQSKPYFLFYKEGKKSGFVEGVNTPHIRAVVKDLCTVKTPASEFITNPRLQEFWEECFNPDESDVPFDKFLKGLLSICKYTVPFSDAEKQVLVDLIGVKDKDKTITAEALQKWVGDDEVKTVPVLVAEALPEYEARAAGVVQREAEERKAQEELRAKEEKEEEARKEAERQAEEERRKAAPAPSAGGTLDDLLAQCPDLASASDALESDKDMEVRSIVEGSQLSIQQSKATILSAEKASEEAQRLVDVVQNAKTLGQLLNDSKGSFVSVNAARSAADKKVDGSIPSLSKLATVLSLCDPAAAEAIVGRAVDFRSLLAAGELFNSEPSMAATLCCTAVLDAPASLSFAGDKDAIAGADALTEGGSFVVPPLTLLSSDATGAFKIVLQGLPHAIALAATEVFATHWFSSFTITAISDTEVTASFVDYVGQDTFDVAATNFSTLTNADEKKFHILEKIQARVAAGETAQPRRSPQPPAEEADGVEATAASNTPLSELAQTKANEAAAPDADSQGGDQAPAAADVEGASAGQPEEAALEAAPSQATDEGAPVAAAPDAAVAESADEAPVAAVAEAAEEAPAAAQAEAADEAPVAGGVAAVESGELRAAEAEQVEAAEEAAADGPPAAEVAGDAVEE